MAWLEIAANGVQDPVLLCNDLGADEAPLASPSAVTSSGHSSMSVKEAVRIAQSNNFMGLVCTSRLLVGSFRSSTSLLLTAGRRWCPLLWNPSKWLGSC